MKNLFAASYFFLAATSARAATPAADAKAAIERAIDAVKKATPECKTAALSKLKDARDGLSAPSPSNDAITKARRAVEDVSDEAENVCAAPVISAAKQALSLLQNLLNASSAQAEAATANEEGKRACWNYVNDWTAIDPGCLKKKNGKGPADKATINKHLLKLRQSADRYEQTAYLEHTIASAAIFTSLQAAALVGALSNDIDRGQIAKQLVRTLVDPENARVIAAKIGSSEGRSDFLEALEFKD